jgi:GDP-4-dehydro-6-deoxy-D-mannose reductase
MRILITGATGFVGQHAIHEFASSGHDVYTFSDQPLSDSRGVIQHHVADLMDSERLQSLVQTVQPDACLHLAGIAFVPLGWTQPNLVMRVNACGTINILEALRHSSKHTRILVVTSGHIYGPSRNSQPLKEEDPLLPDNMYAVSKVSADQITRVYADYHHMHCMTARPHNHIGPRQAVEFVVPSFARQVKAMATKQAEQIMRVGNLDSECDFTDVRDVVRAYRLLLEKGHAGLAYNIATGKTISIRIVLNKLCDIAKVNPAIEIDEAKFRPSVTWPVLDVTRIKAHTGWEPEISLDQSLHDIYSDL